MHNQHVGANFLLWLCLLMMLC